ncbi:divalent-cation tolerance protein CutA [Stakelama sp. CBK3Z-3]|uniref:Divalent-cation tolerance protein CutA n=1 Tax=Stakelama flava TaxID=2860338 RepID=A0ABS6XI55_9SPHN|nr:divalent-cation tolerance protein CutA [Stakelama flava]MBW4329867.1 divalent-cation tolerance protein CutA [Stakelama flava]
MSEIAIVYATFPDRQSADTVAHAVVRERRAACANILGECMSVYHWEGSVQSEREVAALFKAPADAAEQLRDRIVALHPYDLPAVESWTVSVNRAVADWADAAVVRD